MEDHYLSKELKDLVTKDLTIFEFLQAGSLDGIWYWDIEKPENEWLSPDFWTTLGYDPSEKEHLSSEWQDIIFPKDLEVALENFNKHCADPNHPYDQIVRYKHKDGSTVWVRCRGVAIRDEDGKPLRMLGAHTNITIQKNAEEELKAAHAELENRVKERTIKLTKEIEERKLAEEKKEQALAATMAAIIEKEAAEKANKLKSEFLTNMSHELRTPLNSIIGFSEMLTNGLRGEMSEEQREDCTIILNSGRHLLNIIKDILDLSKIEAGKTPLELEKSNVREIINSTEHFVRKQAMAHAIELELEVEDGINSVYIDPVKFKQIAVNLLSNAVKFTPDGGKVSLSARRVESESGMMLEVSVTDTGIGISDEDQKRLFKPFEQLGDVMAKKHGGTGLGLMLVKRLTELHGGTVTVESSTLKGSTFTVSIPYKETI